MITTIDRAGRVVVPKALRSELNIVPGPIEIESDGSSLRLTVPATARLVQDGRFVGIEHSGPPTSVDEVRELRLALQR